jgi:hypothetical protein
VVVPVAVTVSVEVAWPPEVRVTEVGFSPRVTPLGKTADDNETVPAKLFRLWMVIIED